MATNSVISKSERSYIQEGILSNPPRRYDGRSLYEYRPIALETGVAPLANGSARLSIGRIMHDNSGVTEIMAASKLEVEDFEYAGQDGGRIVCSVSCSPAAYPNLSSAALDDLQQDMTAALHQTLSHPSLHPPNLQIIPQKKAWLLHLDVVILSDAGNIYDALFMAARAALWDTKVPRTRSVEYKAPKSSKKGGTGDMDVDEDVSSGFDTRHHAAATDFEIPDYWDEGEVLVGRDLWPVCVTLNVIPQTHFLDALPQEEASSTSRALIVYSFPSSGSPVLQMIRTLGTGELKLSQMKELIQTAEKYAKNMFNALNSKLSDEDARRNQRARARFARR